MASGKTSKRARSTRSSVVASRNIPWVTIAATLVVVLFAGAVLGYVIFQQREQKDRQDALAAFTPSPANPDPSNAIPGIVLQPYNERGRRHLAADQQVAYTHQPPFGGSHDYNWAACNGVIYPKPVRNENMVHSLEHGTVWIAYDSTRITGDGLEALRRRVEGQPYTMLSPYPGLGTPISLQSWGHQLGLSDPSDVRIEQFVKALRRNQFAYPEVGASCSALGPGQFDQDNPPAFHPIPPVSSIDNQKIFGEIDPDKQGQPGEATPGPPTRTGNDN